MMFGEWVRELRRAKGLTLRDVALKVRVNFTYLTSSPRAAWGTIAALIAASGGGGSFTVAPGGSPCASGVMGKVSPTGRPESQGPSSTRRPRPRRSGSRPYLRQIAARTSVIKGAVFMWPLPPFLGEQLDPLADGHFQGIRSVVVVALREVLQLLDEEQRSRRAGLEVQLSLRQVGR